MRSSRIRASSGRATTSRGVTDEPGIEIHIEGLRERLFRMGGRAEAIIDKALRALWERDAELAAEVKQDDVEIDRLEVEIDEAVLKALALQAPVAEDLREVLAVKMIATDLERVGDLARNIAKSARALLGAARDAAARDAHDARARVAARCCGASLDAFSAPTPNWRAPCSARTTRSTACRTRSCSRCCARSGSDPERRPRSST